MLQFIPHLYHRHVVSTELWPLADYVTVHTPLIPQTRSKYRVMALGWLYYSSYITYTTDI